MTMSVGKPQKSKSRLGLYIFIALVLGIIAGQTAHIGITDKQTISDISGYLDLGSMLFLRLIKMIIAPLVFTTLVVGIAKMGDGKSLGRVFAKAMFIFMTGGILSLTLGVVLVEFFQPGKALHEALIGAGNGDLAAATNNVCTNCSITLKSFFESLVPDSSLKGFVENHILQVIVVAVFIGVAGISIGESVAPVFQMFDMFSKLMFKIIGYIMYLAPLAVFTSITKLVMGSGMAVLKLYLIYAAEFYLGLGIIWAVYLILGVVIVGKGFFKIIKELSPFYGTAFAASSSEVALPSILQGLENNGISKKISGFIIPLGYSFNLEASMLNCTFATIFIIQLYGYHIDLKTEITMLFMLLVTSKGIAGIPRASLVIVAATLSAFGYPEAGVLILLPVDSFNDMGRSATNAFANTMSALFVNKWEAKYNKDDDLK
ncbi:MAG: dicarboxylate/amino acid:cation symporter [Neisseriaceae bacterium]|jgi:Na+/H+-dicarboxylate symporter|nr:MAG: dicarboxylate/amino acid:cation symporter [Neisseriaceae bacterium]